MRNRQILVALVMAGLTLANPDLKAGDPPRPANPTSPAPTSQQRPLRTRTDEHSIGRFYLQTSRIIGCEVRGRAGERLGRVQDLIVSLVSDTAPFAIVKYGGTIGLGATRVAVPLKDLKWSTDTRRLTLAATKHEFESASPTPSGGWAVVADDDWARNVDRFYIPPATTDRTFERQEVSGANQGREPVREPVGRKELRIADPRVKENAPQPAELPVATSAPQPSALDHELLTRVKGIIAQRFGPVTGNEIQAAAANGVVTLSGNVVSAKEKQELEQQIDALGGVKRIEDQQLVNPQE